MNQRFHQALNRIPQAIPPVWFMRQAGRYHTHYQKLRAKHSFMDLCKIPELAAEVTLGPIQDFDFDVAILFSDLLFPLEALGMGLSYGDKGPALGWHLTAHNIGQLRSPDEAYPSLLFQGEAMKAARALLPPDKSLIGFVGGPWTLFTYAVQGSHDGSLLEAKKSLGLLSAFAEKLMPLLKKNIELQLQSGAEIVMLFDTAAGELSPDIFKRQIVPYVEILAQAYPKRLGYYSKGTQAAHLEARLFQLGLLAGLGFDHRWPMTTALNFASTGFAQGNFDQALLHLDPEDFRRELKDYFQAFQNLDLKKRAGWVCGLGHGVLPKTPENNVRAFVESLRKVFG